MYSQQQQSTDNNNNDNNNNNNNSNSNISHIRALDLPEIRLAIAAFLPPRLCTPCLLVCKAWYPEFLSRIWRSPNLYPYPLTPKNSHFSATLVAKHGHLIQETGPLFSARQFSFLMDTPLTGLRVFVIQQLTTLPDKEGFNKVLLRQKQLGVILKLEEFKSRGNVLDADTFSALGILPLSSQTAPSLTCLSPSSTTTNSLKCLVLEKMDMDHSIFLEILQYSSHLTHVSLDKVDFVSPASSSSATLRPFMSPSVRTLTATIQQVLHLGSLDLPESYPPLLAHFPNLTIWNISLLNFLDTDIKPTLAHTLHHAVNTYSPLLTDLEFRWGTTELTNSLLAGAFSGLKIRRLGFTNDRSKGKCCFDEMMPGILKHANSLVSVTLYTFNLRPDHDPTPPPSPHMDASNSMFAKVMRSCPRLQTLIIPHCTTSIEAFEHGGEWVCKELETLHVSLQGLVSADSCLTKLKDLRNSDTWRSSGVVEVKGESVDDCVIQKLIGLRHLKRLCLGMGTRSVYLPTI